MKSALRVLVCVLSTHVAEAWGKEGHEIVANIAYKRLSNQAKTAVDKILLQDTYKFLDSYEIRRDDQEETTPLGKVANWADKVRFEHEFHWTAPLHYIDIPDDSIPGGCPCCQNIMDGSLYRSTTDALYLRSSQRSAIQASTCAFSYPRDCVNDMCVVGAIYSFSSDFVHGASHRLREDNGSRKNYNTTITPKQSLMFLTHFMGDIHQPLHVSRKTDKGGNTIDVYFPMHKYSTTRLNERDGLIHSRWNLHSVWDEGIIQHAIAVYFGNSQYQFQRRIEAMLLDHDSGTCIYGTEKDCVSSWASESWNDALVWAYSNEYGKEIVDGDTITNEYFETRLPIIEACLANAAMRLAATIELLFGGSINKPFNMQHH